MNSSDFNKDGYTACRSIIPPEELQEIDTLLQQILDDETSYEYYKNNVLIRIENFVTINNRLKELLIRKDILDIVKQCLGEDPVLFKDKVNFKSPGGTPDVLHQDIQAKWDTYGTKNFVTVGLPLDPCTEETSCVYFYQKQSESPQKMYGDYFEPLSWQKFDKKDFKPLIMYPGDASFHDIYIPHYSDVQKSKNLRRVIWLTFNGASAGNHRQKYYEDKLKNYPPNNKRVDGVKYEFKV